MHRALERKSTIYARAHTHTHTRAQVKIKLSGGGTEIGEQEIRVMTRASDTGRQLRCP